MFPQAAVFDVDETLTPSGAPIPPEITTALAQLLEHMPVAIMTGRDLAHVNPDFLAAMAASPHADRLYAFVNSAAQCFVYRDGVWIA